MRDLYKLLGLTPEASAEDTKKSYRKLALKEHPDKGGDSNRMIILIEAYAILSDPESRQRYHEIWKKFQNTYSIYCFINAAKLLPSLLYIENSFMALSLFPYQPFDFNSGCYVSTHASFHKNFNYSEIFTSLQKEIRLDLGPYQLKLEQPTIQTLALTQFARRPPEIENSMNFIEPAYINPIMELRNDRAHIHASNSMMEYDATRIYKHGSSRHAFFTEGGVSINPTINVKFKEDYTNFNGTPIRASDFKATSGCDLPPNGGGGKPPTSGNGNGNRGDGSGKPKRFEMLVSGETKENVRSMLKEDRLPITPDQKRELLELLRSGQMASISIKKMYNGEVRFYYERPGHTSGFQRMSFKLAENGVKLRVVQTAFDDENNLIHQRPGVAKNNLYDVKK